MSLVIFDLDNTLLDGDSDYLWGQFLVQRGAVDAACYARENHRFYAEYEQGTLDIHAFLEFALRPLRDHPLDTLKAWRTEFLAQVIEPIILPAGTALIDRHRRAGDTLLIITATNSFITRPIAERFQIGHLLATEPEMADGRYTGRVQGIPCFQHGKVERLNQWLADNGADLQDSWFYSDSGNDIPLLARVTYPVAVDPDDRLRNEARNRGWPVVSLRAGAAPPEPYTNA